MMDEEDLQEDEFQPIESSDEDEPLQHEIVRFDGKNESQRPLPVLRGERSLAPVDPLAAYLNEIRKYEELSENEERDLARLYNETGDASAIYRLITSNLKMVVKVAMRFRREWQNTMDLIQEGNVGLMHAVKNFDPFRGVRLPVYAKWWIKAYILKFILDNWRLVKIGTTNTRRKLLYNLNREKEKLEREGFVPSSKLLAERFGVDEKEIIEVQAGLGASDVSMDVPVNEGSHTTPAHYLSAGTHPEEEVEAEQFRDLLRKTVDTFAETLKPIEREIIENRIFSDDPVSLREIGDRHQVTREAIRQTEQRMLKKLKAHLLKTMPEVAEYFNNG
tara:strand:- start:3537 stop:4535 length:999 start_codon:yes stop_codon:yes gene_type:complete